MIWGWLLKKRKKLGRQGMTMLQLSLTFGGQKKKNQDSNSQYALIKWI